MSFLTSLRERSQEQPVGEVVLELKAGFSSGKFELGSGDIPHLRPMNITEDCTFTWEGTKYITSEFFQDKHDYMLSRGDILFNNTNSTELVGKSCFLDRPIKAGFSNHMTRVRTDPAKVESYFLALLFQGMWKRRIFESYCHKWVNQSGINTQILAKIPLRLPPLDEQRRVIDLFLSLEQSILEAEQQERTLFAIKHQLLRELFGAQSRFGNLLTSADFGQLPFGSLAFNISERVEPRDTAAHIYVGLEHLDSDDLVIHRTGKPADVIGTKLKIYKGDIIFGKRRAYLRKVAVAHFDGIASAHSMVLRANPQNIDPGLLPFFMQSNEFMERAMRISEGSLSPTIKWKTLSREQFRIPVREKQPPIVELFGNLDQATELARTETATLRGMKQALLNEILA